MRLSGSIHPSAELPPDVRDRMFALMAENFDGMFRETFEQDLAGKDWVIVLRDRETETIQGFSTLQQLEATVQGRKVRALFSGDTIIHRDYWGETELASVWGAHVLSLIEDAPAVPLYWFLISKGYRTYKFLPAYFHDYYPRPDQPTPPFEEELLALLAESKYPGCYDREAGVIRLEGSDRLNSDLAEITPAKLKDPHVRFFLERNPGFRDGHELACLTELTVENLRPLARRIFNRYRPQAVEA